MSSSYISPFEIESRRLRGIVTECQRQLERAASEMEEQIRAMESREERLRQEQEQYRAEQNAALQNLHSRRSQMQAQEKAEKEAWEERLRQAERKTMAFQRTGGGLEESIGKLQRIKRIAREETSSLPILSRMLDEYEEGLRQAMQDAAEESARQSRSRNSSQESSRDGSQNSSQDSSRSGSQETDEEKLVSAASRRVRGRALNLPGAKTNQSTESLTVSSTEQSTDPSKKTPVFLFRERLEYACSLPRADRFSSLSRMKEEFRLEAEASQARYAVEHMDALEEMIRQIESLIARREERSSKWEKLRRYYLAICRLVKEDPREELLEREENQRMLLQEYKRLCHIYQQAREQEYIFHAVSEVMGRHGLLLQSRQPGAMNFRYGDGMNIHLSSDEHRSLEMHVSGSFTGRQPTVDERRKSVIEARKICQIQRQMEQELAEEYGILLQNPWREEPTEENMVMVQRTGEGRRTEGQSSTQLADRIEF